MSDGAEALYAAAEATWPPARRIETAGFALREGLGGGSRVSAATALQDWSAEAIGAAEDGMSTLGQSPLFQIREGQHDLDRALAARGYSIVDPVTIWTVDTAAFLDVAIPRVTVFDLWEPLAIQREMWDAAGIGPARRAVMSRASGPKTALLGRTDDKPGGTAFCAVHEDIGVLHALEIAPGQRRKGMARWMVTYAAQWAARQGASRLMTLAIDENRPASALYASLGFAPSASYHYRTRMRWSAQ
ncbi:acetyltransferase [Roseivivax halodurans JCM 10272]|uniref:Acetyltransferase n=1 Tax=Roseivivax halodurans JCM 10272 TaxID=1449350 RepID=X7ED67_9RHOB|nr:GNAT family N-acetyltransferase [Roseivivax halodurans]ETX13820.1 acetyltransferase [Roseivivax halodurans JCM 10272]